MSSSSSALISICDPALHCLQIHIHMCPLSTRLGRTHFMPRTARNVQAHRSLERRTECRPPYTCHHCTHDSTQNEVDGCLVQQAGLYWLVNRRISHVITQGRPSIIIGKRLNQTDDPKACKRPIVRLLNLVLQLAEPWYWKRWHGPIRTSRDLRVSPLSRWKPRDQFV